MLSAGKWGYVTCSCIWTIGREAAFPIRWQDVAWQTGADGKPQFAFTHLSAASVSVQAEVCSWGGVSQRHLFLTTNRLHASKLGFRNLIQYISAIILTLKSVGMCSIQMKPFVCLLALQYLVLKGDEPLQSTQAGPCCRGSAAVSSQSACGRSSAADVSNQRSRACLQTLPGQKGDLGTFSIEHSKTKSLELMK